MPQLKKKLPSTVATTKTPSVPSSAEEFITTKQLAERLHVKPSTIYEWTRRREKDCIPHFPISRKVVLFRWSDVVCWVEGKAA